MFACFDSAFDETVKLKETMCHYSNYMVNMTVAIRELRLSMRPVILPFSVFVFPFGKHCLSLYRSNYFLFQHPVVVTGIKVKFCLMGCQIFDKASCWLEKPGPVEKFLS